MAAKKTVEAITIKPIVRLRTKIRILFICNKIRHEWEEKEEE